MKSPTTNDNADNVAAAATATAAAPPAVSDESRSRPELDGHVKPPPYDHSGEYLVWLDDDCPVFSATVCGVSLQKYRDIYALTCPRCEHRWEPAQPPVGGQAFAVDRDARERYRQSLGCPRCGHAHGQRRANQRPRRVRKRMLLTDAQVRAIWSKLDPDRPRIVARDAKMAAWRGRVAEIRAHNDRLGADDATRIPYPEPPREVAGDRTRLCDGPKTIRVRSGDTGYVEDAPLYSWVRMVPAESFSGATGESQERAAERERLNRERSAIYDQLETADTSSERQQIRKNLERIDERLSAIARLD